ncbi:MAG: bifunctional folylpolyglutamate synthase/dihydrofolate synthase, partial [Lachnospiraceae bacterium]|nr:bifunctional folylpolyglutamate synthase/dihydrofolate synthase [Lachnospiraceae bacterium]
GRGEKVCDHPVVIRDGAHNVDAAKALRESIQKHFTNQRLIFIIGVLKDKEYDKMMAVLCPLADRVYTITPEGQRGLPAAILRESILPYCKQVTACSSVKKAMSAAKQDCQQYEQLGKASAIIAWGSLSYIGQI